MLHKFFIYRNKWVQPYLRRLFRWVDAFTFLAAMALIIGVVYEYGFFLPAETKATLSVLYRGVWVVFLVHVTLHLTLSYRETCRRYRTLTWFLNVLLYLTLIPFFFRPGSSGVVYEVCMCLEHPWFLQILLLLLSLLQLSSGVVRLLGKRTNPSLILIGSFLLIVVVGTGLLMLPRCTVSGISWVDSLFISTSAVCVTGLVPLDVATTFTLLGKLVIVSLIQIGGVGVMTLTSFFAMFFTGNTSLYNQVVVRDMISSDSLSSLLSTLVYILFFTLFIEGVGMLSLFFSIHGTMGMDVREELFFAAFHSVSAFCNAGFSTLSGNLGHEALMHGHSSVYLTVSVLVILGGIGFPILVNFKTIVVYHVRRLFFVLGRKKREVVRIRHLYNLNTKIVLMMTMVLLVVGSVGIALFEWNGAFAGMTMGEKLVHSFFNAVSPRTAGFNGVSLNLFSVQSILLIMGLMCIGGAAQSTAGGIKVNAVTVVFANLLSVLRGKERVEVFQRQLSVDSIRRANAALLMYLVFLCCGVFVLTFLEPDVSLLSLFFECISALSTVGMSLDLTPILSDGGKLFVAMLMFIGRVGVITLMLGLVPLQQHTRYKYPNDNIIIN